MARLPLQGFEIGEHVCGNNSKIKNITGRVDGIRVMTSIAPLCVGELAVESGEETPGKARAIWKVSSSFWAFGWLEAGPRRLPFCGGGTPKSSTPSNPHTRILNCSKHPPAILQLRRRFCVLCPVNTGLSCHKKVTQWGRCGSASQGLPLQGSEQLWNGSVKEKTRWVRVRDVYATLLAIHP